MLLCNLPKKPYCGLIAVLVKKIMLKERSKVKAFSMLSEFSRGFLHELCKCWVVRGVQKLSQRAKWANFCINVTAFYTKSMLAQAETHFQLKKGAQKFWKKVGFFNKGGMNRENCRVVNVNKSVAIFLFWSYHQKIVP